MSVLYFDLCAIPVLLIILISTFVRRATNGLSNKLFIAVCLISLCSTICDIACAAPTFEVPLSANDIFFTKLFTYLYFIFRNGTIVVYMFFLFAVTRATYRFHNKAVLTAGLLPYGVLLAVLLTNPIHHKVFTVTPYEGYQRGSWIIVLYVISLGYALYGTIYLLHGARYLQKIKWYALLAMYMLTFVSVAVQFFFPEFLVELFFTSIALLLVIILVLRPEEIADSSVGLPSYKAYQIELNKILSTRQKAQVFIIRFINSVSIRSFIGEEKYDYFIKHIAEQIGMLCRRERLSWELYYERPGTFYVIVDNMDFDISESIELLYTEVQHRTHDIAEMGVKFETKVCGLRIPEDLSSYDEILRFGREYVELMPYETVFVKASDILGSKDYEIKSNMAVIINQAITGGRLEMYYQPIYCVKEDKFISAEALVRLRDERYGMISPALFIPEAEKKGLIIPIGNFVLEAVFCFAALIDFEELGLEFIELNLSVAQCMQSGLPAQLKELSERYCVPPKRINLEITETTFDNVGGIMDKNIRELVDMGFSFSLDDYGVGYSNMQRVTKLPFKHIKIDKSLVDDINTTDGMTILTNTIQMMKGIRKKIIAEGAEDREAVDKLKLMGCDYIQGFYYARPVPAEQFVRFLEENNGRK